MLLAGCLGPPAAQAQLPNSVCPQAWQEVLPRPADSTTRYYDGEWREQIGRALGFGQLPTELVAPSRAELARLWSRDSAAMAWNLAVFVAYPGTSDDFTADNAAAEYRRRSGAALPLLVALLEVPTPERRGLALGSISHLDASRQRAVVLSFACDAMSVLQGIASADRASTLPASWISSHATTIQEARRLLGSHRPAAFDSLLASIDRALARSYRRSERSGRGTDN